MQGETLFECLLLGVQFGLMGSRIQYTKRNIIVSYIFMILQLLSQFITRSVIVNTLGEEFLGLSSVFSSILGVLNIAELGVTTSIIFFLYKPLAEKDTGKVCALLAFLRKAYLYIGVFILGVGVVLTPTVELLISGDIPSNINIYILYILYLLNTVAGYFLYAHKVALLTAVQRLDLTKVASGIVLVVQNVLQIVVLIVFHNYYLFIIIMILGTVTTNLVTSYICNKYYAEYKCSGTIDKTTKKGIASKIKGMMICNISSVTYTSLDSIIITYFNGLSLVAVYSNYMTVFNAISSLIFALRSAMQASVGNSVAVETVHKNYKDLLTWQFGFSILGTVCMSCLICLYQPFMTLWMGSDMLLTMFDVVLISIWFLVSVVQNAFYLYLMGDGLFIEMRWAYIFSTCFNLLMNIILGKLWGVTGIILASLLSSIISGTFWQCILIFKHYFKKSPTLYIVNQFIYFAIAGLISTVSFWACSYISANGIFGLIFRLLLCIFISFTLVFIFYFKHPYFKISKDIVLNLIKMRGRK